MENAEFRIKKSQIQLWKDKPFWAYLSYFLKFQEVPKEETKYMTHQTMGVDINGNVYYCKDFIDKLSDEELKGVIAHELGHLIYLTELRQGNRDKDGFNIASDIAINSLLVRDNFTLPKGVLLPDYNDEIKTGFGKKIKNCSEKLAEEIYDELPKVTIDKNGNIYAETGSGKNKKKEKIGKVLDGHIISNKGKGKGKDKGIELSEAEKKEIEQNWKDRLVEAYTTAKMKGNVPAGIERILGKLDENKIDWKTLLQRYLMNSLPYDYTWQKPSKQSIATQVYSPSILKEKISVVIAIDLSGSIGKEEYSEFMSEIIGLAKAFQERIKMHFYSHDIKCYDGGIIENGNLEKIKNLKLKGGGGTSHQDIFNKITDNIMDCKAVIFFTDGFSDLDGINFEEYPFDKIFVITKEGDEECLKDKPCQVIKLED